MSRQIAAEDGGRCAVDHAVDVAGLIGRRVALRHVVGQRDGRPLHTDAVGDLSRDGDVLVVATRSGPVRVAPEAVTAVRAIPPAPPQRAPLAAVARLEGLCADAWPAPVDEPLGAWRLRAAGGYTGRANGALAVGSPGRPVAEALDAVREFAGRNGITPRVQVPIGSPWDRAVEREGWVLDTDHEAGAEVTVQVIALAALTNPGHPQPTAGAEAPDTSTAVVGGGSTGVRVEEGTPPPAWWAISGDPGPAGRHVLTAAADVAFLTAGDALAVGALRVAVVEDHAHFSVLLVTPDARRRGIGSALMRAGAVWASGRGARFGVLQVALHNAGARALYARLGFTEHHRYRYLVPARRFPPPRRE
jgi:N-acetylglutamate synthase